MAAAQHICFTAIRLYYFPRFKQSELFYKLLDGRLLHDCMSACSRQHRLNLLWADFMHLHGIDDGDASEPTEDEEPTDLEPVDTADETRFSHDPTMLGQVKHGLVLYAGDASLHGIYCLGQ